MKMGSFLLGGLAGAAAAVYFSRNGGKMSEMNWQHAGKSVKKAMDNAKTKFSEMNLGELISKSPQVKHEVDEILRQNNEEQPSVQ